MILIIGSWSKPMKTKPCYLRLAILAKCYAYHNRLIFACYCSILNCLILTGVSFEIQKHFMLENLKMKPPTNNQTILKTPTQL